MDETESEISRVYPNPCSQYLTFSFTGNNRQIRFELYDLQGRKLISISINNNETIPLGGLDNGIYVYELSTRDGKIQSGRQVKE
jgi:hypothetical protein